MSARRRLLYTVTVTVLVSEPQLLLSVTVTRYWVEDPAVEVLAV